MPNKIKALQTNSFSLTHWDTGNLSINTTESIDQTELNEALIRLEYAPQIDMRSFIYLCNLNIKTLPGESFIFINTDQPDEMVEYISNEGIVRISRDEMRADMALNPASTFDNVMGALERLNIVFGVNQEALRARLINNDASFFTLAEGQPGEPPVPPQYDYEYLTERPLPIPLKKKDKVTFIDFTIQNRVIKDTELVETTEAIQGKPGKTISGFTVPVELDAENDVVIGENVYEQDGKIIAAISGMAAFNDKLIAVFPTLVINKPVKSKTIFHKGTVIIQNNAVNSKIRATRDVIIHGSVEECQIESDGFVYLLTGCTGKRTKIKAKLDIFTPSVYHSNLESLGGNIYVAYETYHGHMKAKGPIVVERKIAGGIAESMSGIKVDTAGGERMNVATELRLFTDNEDTEKLNDLLHKLRTAESELKQVHIRKKKMEIQQSLNRQTSSDPEYMRTIQLETTLQDLVHQLKDAVDSLKSFMDDRDSRMILIYGNVWRGVKIMINNFELDIKDDNYPSSFVLGDYGILRKKYGK